MGMPTKSFNSNIWILEPPEFMDYLRPRLKDFVTHNFITKWQDKVEPPCLIFPFKIFEGPLQVLHMCKLFYIRHLTYKFNVFYRPFTRALKILNHYFFVRI
jgi:hypothetical protein